jgi:hypothetical protein
MRTLVEVLFLLSMIVPAAAVLAGTAMLFATLLINGRRQAGDAAAAQARMALEQPAGR